MVTQLGFAKSLGQVAWSQGGGNTFLGGSVSVLLMLLMLHRLLTFSWLLCFFHNNLIHRGA